MPFAMGLPRSSDCCRRHKQAEARRASTAPRAVAFLPWECLPKLLLKSLKPRQLYPQKLTILKAFDDYGTFVCLEAKGGVKAVTLVIDGNRALGKKQKFWRVMIANGDIVTVTAIDMPEFDA